MFLEIIQKLIHILGNQFDRVIYFFQNSFSKPEYIIYIIIGSIFILMILIYSILYWLEQRKIEPIDKDHTKSSTDD